MLNPLQYLRYTKRSVRLSFCRNRRDFLNAKKLSFFSKKLYIRRSPSSSLNLRFGDSAIINSQPVVLSNGFMLKFVLLLKRVVRKRGKSFRFFFFQPSNLLKISKQSKGARMGKGKGKSISLVQRFYPYKPMVEFSGVRSGRLLYYTRFFSTRLSAPLFLYTGVCLSLFPRLGSSSAGFAHAFQLAPLLC